MSKLHDKNRILEGQLSNITSVVEKVLYLLENRLGECPSLAENPLPFIDIVPQFQTLKTAFDGSDFRHFIYEYLTNKTDESWQALSSAERHEFKSKYNKQVIAANTFGIFMDKIIARHNDL